MMEVMVTTGVVRRTKLQSNRHHQQTNNTQCFTGRMPSCRPTNTVGALKEKVSHSKDLLSLGVSLVGGLPTLSLSSPKALQRKSPEIAEVTK